MMKVSFNCEVQDTEALKNLLDALNKIPIEHPLFEVSIDLGGRLEWQKQR